MRASISCLALAFALGPLACGGAEDSPLIGNGNGNPNNGTDGGTNPIGTDGGAAQCDLSRCGVTVPDGFTVVTSVDAKASCPNGFAQHDAVVNPTAEASACSCNCNITQQPDCTKGAINRSLDYMNQPQCNQGATQVNVMGAGCAQLPNPIQTSGWHYSATMTPGPGVCSWDAKVDTSKVGGTAVRTCEPPSSCPGAACGGNVCVSKAGDVACPSAFPKKQLVGKASVECSACAGACAVEGACSGTLSFFTDGQCQQGKRDFPVDGTCNGNNNMAGLYYSFQYTGSAKGAKCAGAAPASTPTAKIDQATTVCCQK